jgi:hypothetical protein
MKNKSYCNHSRRLPQINRAILPVLLWVFVSLVTCVPPVSASGEAPPWMHSLVGVPLPAHDEKTDAVLLYSESNVNVLSTDKIKVVVRKAYKILRPGGREYGTVMVFLNSNRKVTTLHGWSIPAQGKDFEVKAKEGVEISPPKIQGGELIDDVKAKVIDIPAADPGNIVGYEYEVEEHPLVLQRVWDFQEEIPAREVHYSLQVPSGWEVKSSWLNYAEAKPTQSASNQWQWVLTDVKGVRKEEDMPPLAGLVGQMIVSFYPAGGPALNGFSNWQQMGLWYANLTNGRRDPSPEIKQKVIALTAQAPTQLDKMRAIANFVQNDIRYVAIELGIGGWQPHPAADIFTHRYGDCKDKATLVGSMLSTIGVDSYYVVINTERGSVTADTPAHNAFDHAIIAIKLPDTVSDPSLLAIQEHPKLGRLLFFDPTSELTPFGHIPGYLQANFGLLVTQNGGELVQLPKQPASMNSLQRTAKLTLDTTGRLAGTVEEVRLGDRASAQRYALRAVTASVDKIKPIESLLAGSLSNFRITKASVVNLSQSDRPFGFNYTFEAENYAKNAGSLLLLRPRVIGTKARGILETKESRQFPIEFDGPMQDTDNFEIAIPEGYEVDELPPPVDADFSFASYHSRTEVKGNVIGYTRTFEIKELSVPVSKAEELKKFYRIIAGDERNTAVLKPSK